MALKFDKLTRAAVKTLIVGHSIAEHGIIARKGAHGDVTYAVNIMVDGQRIHRAIGKASEGVTREQAERAIETLRTRAREGRLDLPKGRKTALTFAEAAPAYIGRLGQEGGKGIPRKQQHLTSRLVPFLGLRRLGDIKGTDGEAYAEHRTKGGAKAGTINRELATLSHLLRQAAKWGWINQNQVPRIRKMREGAGRIIALSEDQCRSLMDAALDDLDEDLWLFVAICLQTSMRHGEARRLRWEQFDANRKRFFIPEAKAGERDQPLPPALVETLLRVQSKRGQGSGYLFRGGPGSTSGYRHTFRKAFARAVKRAGLDPSLITPHVMRHTAITRLVKAGIDLPTIQRVSGHRTLGMVLRYAHVDGLHVDNAIEHLALV